MAKNFSQYEEDNPVMAVLNAAKEEQKQTATEILGVTQQPKAPVSEQKTEPAAAETKVVQTPAATQESPVEVKKILMNISIRESTKKDWKMFFLEHDLSMTQGIETAVEYLKSEVAKGNIKLSKGGITK